MAQVNGVLPVPAIALASKSATSNGTPAGSTSKTPTPRLKVVLRRLPPGLTPAEFEAALGEEWKVGAGKVDYCCFKPGKISKDLAKPSRPSRAYFKLKDQGALTLLSNFVRQTPFTDAKSTSRDPVLIGPPSLEFSPYPRVPQSRVRTDARQGLIDQDPEFKQFLESLTNPITKPELKDDEEKKEEKVTTTPLIEAIREKKAQKDKPQPSKSASSKHSRGESKEEREKSKSGKSGKDSSSAEKGKRQSRAEKEKAAKEVKLLKKEAASGANASSQTTSSSAEQPKRERERDRERGSTSAAKLMLQRDLGLAPAAGRRRGAAKNAESSTTASPAQTPTTPATPKTQGAETPAPTSTRASGKGDSRPSRAERRAAKEQKLAEKGNVEGGSNQTSSKGSASNPVNPPKILKKPANTAQSAQQQQTTQGGKAPATPNARAASAKSNQQNSSAKASNNHASSTPAATTPTTSATASTSPAAALSQTSRQAFLKHANPSQGITEPLIQEALSIFGAVEKVEIDKRKGFAYVDFVEPEGLQKAIAAKKVKVAEGAVEIMERKDRAGGGQRPAASGAAPAQRGGFRGRGRGGGRGGMGRGGSNSGGASANAGNANTSAPGTPAIPKATPASAPASGGTT